MELLADKDLQTQIAALTPDQLLDLDLGEAQHDLSLESLRKLPSAIRTLLLFVSFVIAAASGQGQSATMAHFTSISETMLQLHESLRGRVQRVRDTALTRHTTVLRAALFLVKSAILTPEFTQNPSQDLLTKRLLWSTIFPLTSTIYTSALEHALLSDQDQSEATVSKDLEQAAHVLLLLIKTILPVLKQSLKDNLGKDSSAKAKGVLSCICCRVLSSLLLRCGSPAVEYLARTAAEDMLKQGILPPVR